MRSELRPRDLVLVHCGIALLLLGAFAAVAAAKPKPIAVKVVVVTMFEVGATPATRPANCNIGWSATTWTAFIRCPPATTPCA